MAENPELDALNIARQLQQELRYQYADLEEILGVKRRINIVDKELLGLHRKIQDSVSKLNQEGNTTKSIRKQQLQDQNLLNKLIKEQKTLTNAIQGNISKDVEGIRQHKGKVEELNKELKKVADQYENLASNKNVDVGEAVKLAQKKKELETRKKAEEDSIQLLEKGGMLETERIEILSKLAEERFKLENSLTKLLELSRDLTEEEKTQFQNSQTILDSLSKEYTKQTELLSVQGKRALYTQVSVNQMKQVQKLREEELKKEKAINNSYGLTGIALYGLTKIASKFNMGHILDDLKELGDSIRKDLTKEVEKGGGKAVGFLGKVKAMGKGIGGALGIMGKGLIDPLFLLTKILTAFLDVNKANVRLQRLTGQNAVAIAGLNTRLIDSVDFLNTAADITEQLGFNAQNVITTDTLAGAAEMKNLLGLSSEEAGGIAVLTQAIGGNIDQVTDSIVDEISAFNKANRSAVSQGVVLKDVAKTSLGIKAALGGNPKAITQAATAARRLGMELAQVDRIADSLMDFESSIQNELEAQLLIGKNINLGKARELALNNDLAGLGEELFNNSADIEEFGRMNRIQQEAYAKALGMSKDELGRIAYLRGIESGMTKEQAAAAASVKKEDMERIAVQESLNKSLAKLAQAFAPILEMLVFVVEWITEAITIIARVVGGITGIFGKVIRNSNTLNENLQETAASAGDIGKGLGDVKGQATQASMGFMDLKKEGVDPLSIAMAGMFTVVGINKTSKFFSFLKGQFTETTQIAKGLFNAVKNIGGELVNLSKGGNIADILQSTVKGSPIEVIKDAAKEGMGGKVEDVVKEAAGKVGGTVKEGVTGKVEDAVKEAAGKAGDTVKEGVTGKVEDAVKKATGLEGETESVKPGAGSGIRSFLTNLGHGLRSLGKNWAQSLKGVVVLAAASIGAIAPLVGALHLLKNIDPAVMLGFSATLASLGMTLFVMGKLGPGIMKGVLAIGLMAIAILPLTAALKNLSGIDLNSILSAGAAIGIFSAAVFGLGALMSTGVGAALFGFGLVAITGLGLAIGVLGIGLKSVSEGITPFTEFIKTAARDVRNLAGLGGSIRDFTKGLRDLPLASDKLLPFFSMLEKYNPQLLAFANSLSIVAASLTTVAAAAASISTEKLQEAASITATQTVSPGISTRKGEVEEGISPKTLPVRITPVVKEPTVKGITEEKFVAKIDELITEIRKGGNVYLDSNKVGYTLTLGATKLA